MKNIYELLTAIGIDLPEDKKADFDKEFTANYKTVAEADKLTAARDNYKSRLETAETALKEFEGVDVSELNGRIAKLQDELAAAETAHQQKLADMEFSAALESAITASGARNSKAVRPFLDIDALKASKNQADDIKAALEKVKADEAWLFGADEPINNAVKETNGTFSGKAFDSLRAAMGLPAENKS